ncbi:toll/interleukin-1 receptor domain-containing adapter protein [Lethenteron reissneri]|uniref:toll/interleukin-1 receptor domain-containing adapter protein n=1 Tax=Lethenteron reissneri TaxID=7753 RepID=UPI002AB6AF0C|nr:toll/interleukin-1 receptor domain-containing adapter protein [Lethenteron reissneri]
MTERPYDAYLCCSREDDEWAERVTQYMEAAPNNLRVCLSSRDFVPGMAIVDNVCNAVQSSHLILLVLSLGFLESGWCDLETILALTNSAQATCVLERNRRVVPVLLEPCNVPERLGFLTRLDAREPDFLARLVALVQRRVPLMDADCRRPSLEPAPTSVPEARVQEQDYFDVQNHHSDVKEETELQSCQNCQEWQLKCNALENEIAKLEAKNGRLVLQNLPPSPISGVHSEQPLPLVSFNQASVKLLSVAAAMGMVPSIVSSGRFSFLTWMCSGESLCLMSQGILLSTRLLTRVMCKTQPGLVFE